MLFNEKLLFLMNFWELYGKLGPLSIHRRTRRFPAYGSFSRGAWLGVWRIDGESWGIL